MYGSHSRARAGWPGRAWPPRALAAAALLALAVTAVLPAGAATAAHGADGLVLRYALDASTGAVAEDSSGHGRHGVVNGVASWSAGDGLGFNGTDTYIAVPDGVLAGMTAISVALEVFIDPDQASPYFIYGFGNSSAGAGTATCSPPATTTGPASPPATGPPNRPRGRPPATICRAAPGST